MVQKEMLRMGYDEVWMDPWGNVIGLVKGEKGGKSVMFNGHMDHVDTGNPEEWPYPPFSGKIQKGLLWGRGSADMKATLASMVYALGMLAENDIRPPGDIYMAAVVQEEVGGFGTHKLVQTLQTDFAVIGEASANRIARGHRGRVEVIVQMKGESVHASAPQGGVNPLAVLTRFLQRLEELELAKEGTFGGSTVAPTLVYGDNSASNVIPNQVTLHLDWRNVPGETAQDVIQQLQPLLNESIAEVDGSTGSLGVLEKEYRTWTGKSDYFRAVFPSYCLEKRDPLIQQGQEILSNAFAHPVDVIVWPFATDGGHLMEAGIPVLGFGPSEIHTLHTVREHISIKMLTEGMLGYSALALGLGNL
ncbi:MAG: M20/M25/M40 family metallo-hydrolase [Anaerolineales bacterium]